LDIAFYGMVGFSLFIFKLKILVRPFEENGWKISLSIHLTSESKLSKVRMVLKEEQASMFSISLLCIRFNFQDVE